MNRTGLLLTLVLGLILAAPLGCTSDSADDDDASTGTDGDTDGDTDIDAGGDAGGDGDADGDADGDTDGDGDTDTATHDCSDPAAGVGDVCAVPDNDCDCDNVCGQHIIDDPTFLAQYCYAECDQLSDGGLSCESADDVCLDLTPLPDGGVDAGESTGPFACVPLGTATGTNFTAKILKEGAKATILDVTMNNKVNVTFGSTVTTLGIGVGQMMTDTISGTEYVAIIFQGTTGGYSLQITVEKSKWKVGTLVLDNDTQDFNATFLRMVVSGTTVTEAYIEGLAISGTMTITKATLPGGGKSAGSFQMNILGYKAQIDPGK
jgi:hypothetical protein